MVQCRKSLGSITANAISIVFFVCPERQSVTNTVTVTDDFLARRRCIHARRHTDESVIVPYPFRAGQREILVPTILELKFLDSAAEIQVRIASDHAAINPPDQRTVEHTGSRTQLEVDFDPVPPSE